MAQIVSLATYRAARGQRATASEASLDNARLLSERRKHPRQGEPGNDRRSEGRSSVEGRCAPTVAVAGRVVSLANVSRSGLMIRAQFQAKPGARMLLVPPGGVPLSARLIWNRNGLAGLEAPLVATELRSI